MTSSRTYTTWSLAVSAVMLSPIIVIFLIPLTIGLGMDIFEVFGKVPFALVLGAPLALVLLRLFSPWAIEFHLTALSQPRRPLHRSAELNYAPKSIG